MQTERQWPPYVVRSGCGHIEHGDVNGPVYPLATEWCPTCGHYVQVVSERAAVSGEAE